VPGFLIGDFATERCGVQALAKDDEVLPSFLNDVFLDFFEINSSYSKIIRILCHLSP